MCCKMVLSPTAKGQTDAITDRDSWSVTLRDSPQPPGGTQGQGRFYEAGFKRFFMGLSKASHHWRITIPRKEVKS